MRRVRKIAIVLVACVCSVAILLLIAALLTPLLLEKNALGGKVCSGISKLIGGDFEYTDIDIAVFPSPHVVLTNPKIRIPNYISISAAHIEVHPEIMALLTGHLSFKKAVVKLPRTTVWLSNSSNIRKPGSDHPLINEMLSSFFATIAKLPIDILSVEQGIITEGIVTLIYGRKGTVVLDNVAVEIRNVLGAETFEMTAASDLFAGFSATGTIDTRRHSGSANIELDKVKLGAVYNSLLPSTSLQIENGEADISLDLRFENSVKLNGEFTCSASDIRLRLGDQKADISGEKISGNIHLDPSSANIVISEFIVHHPSMRLSGSVGVSVEHPKLNVQLLGRSIDINSTRSIMTALAGTNDVVKTIVGILQGGEISLLKVSAQADTLSGLTDPDNLVLQGSLTQGEIVVPGANLPLSALSGDAGIAKGILTGENILAKWQNSEVHKGNFKINLAKDPLPLQLEAAIHVDAADIPALSAHFITDRKINNELGQLQGLQGSTAGKISLTGDTDLLNVEISVTDIELSARHQKFPFPLVITDGVGSYNGEKIQWEGINIALGASSFTAVSGNIALAEGDKVAITSGTSHIVMADLVPWLSSNSKTRRIAGYYGGGKGILQLSEIEAGGSVQDLGQVHFRLAGQINDLTIQHLPWQSGPLKIDRMKFAADQNTLNFVDGRLSMLDGSLTASGKMRNYLGDNKDISLNFSGRMGPQFMGWAAVSANLPPWLMLRPLVVRKSHLTYMNRGKQRVSATLMLQDSMEVHTELSIAKNVVEEGSFKVKDNYSGASLTATKSGHSFNVAFDGILHDYTVNQIVQITPPIRGSIGGKARVSINPAAPFTASLIGEINGENLIVPFAFDRPLKIKNVALNGAADTMTVKSTNISWGDTVFSLAGTIHPDIGGPMKVDLDVEADSIDADAIMRERGSDDGQPGKETASGIFPLPMEGLIRLKANRFKASDYSFSPVQAEMYLQQEKVDVIVKDMDLCGVSVPGVVHLSPQNFSFHLVPAARDQQVNAAANCFGGNHFKADGRFNLSGVFEGHGAANDLVRSTAGRLNVKIEDGNLYRDFILINILKFLNITQVLTGSVSAENMLQKGISFKLLQADIELHEGKLAYKSFVLDANELKLSGTGTVDILSKRIDFTVLVALQSTLNTFLGYIPLVGGLLQSIPTIPLGLRGTIDDVHVVPLTPSSIGFKLRDTFKQIFNIPLKIIKLDEYLGETAGDAK